MHLPLILLTALSPYLSQVYEYRPAPGQFINEVPEIPAGATPEEVLSIVEEQLTGAATPGLVSLGAFGGYLVAGFDHPVVNLPGQKDLKVYGNAIPNGSEPGIVSVSFDANGNGLPDDPWYELAGSSSADPSTLSDYTITYRRPEPGAEPTPHPDWKFVTDAYYIPWTDSLGESGHVMKISSHIQSYWPEWLAEGELTFTGTRLASNVSQMAPTGLSYTIDTLPWGYADNESNKTLEGFDISDARTAEGEPANLECIHFIRIHTAINSFRGWLGECSTEVAGAEDLHPEAELSAVPSLNGDERHSVRIQGRCLIADCPSARTLHILTPQGNVAMTLELPQGESSIELSQLPKGLYLLDWPTGVKFVVD